LDSATSIGEWMESEKSCWVGSPVSLMDCSG
jgi:hypothetical protein